jgi:hypothetical protein
MCDPAQVRVHYETPDEHPSRHVVHPIAVASEALTTAGTAQQRQCAASVTHWMHRMQRMQCNCCLGVQVKSGDTPTV